MAHGERAAIRWGKDYWGKRPGNKWGGGPRGRVTKQLTHRRERQIKREIEKRVMDDPEAT